MSSILYELTCRNMRDVVEILLGANVAARFDNYTIKLNGKTYVEGDVVWDSGKGLHLMKFSDWDNFFNAGKKNLSLNPDETKDSLNLDEAEDLKVSECPRTYFLTKDNVHDIYMRISRYVKDNVQLDGDAICLRGKDRFTRLSEGDVIWEPREGYFIPIDRDDYYSNYEPTPEVKNEKQDNEQQLRKEFFDNTMYVIPNFIPRIYHLTNNTIETVYNRMRLYGHTVYPYGDKTGKKIGIARINKQEIVLGSGDVIMEPTEGVFLPFKYEDYVKLSNHALEL